MTDRILDLLDGVPFTILDHPPITGAEDAARLRGTPLEIGGKSILLKADRFVLLVLSGARRLDNPGLRAALGVSRYRFATAAELADITGLRPGCVPPFGRPLFDVDLIVDTATAEIPRIAFSLADPTRSVEMATADWLAVARPDRIAPISR